jgi:hypothetical protein
MKGIAAAVAVGAVVLLAGLVLGFYAGKQYGSPAAKNADEQAPASNKPPPVVAEALVGKWRLLSVNSVHYNELSSKEWHGPIVVEFGPENRLSYGNWYLSAGDFPRLSPAGVLTGTYRFLDDEHLLLEGKPVEKDKVKAVLAKHDRPVKWVARIKSISEKDLLLSSLHPSYEARYSRTSDKELEQTEKLRQEKIREYEKLNSQKDK